MTIKEISKKYDIPYNIVYQATYGLEASKYYGRERKYDEKAVVHNLKAILQSRISRYSETLEDLKGMLNRMNKTAD